jgi:hypothetical protein
MLQSMGASLNSLSFDCRGFARLLFSRTAPGALALALGASAGGWILHTLPENGPRFALTPRVAAVANVPKVVLARTVASVVIAASPVQTAPSSPYGALVDPGFSFGANPQSSSVVANLEPNPPASSAVTHEPENALPAPKPALSQALNSAALPVPPSRPAELRAPANGSISLRRFAQGGRAAPATPADNRNFFEKLFGMGQPAGGALAYAAAPEKEMGATRNETFGARTETSPVRSEASGPSTSYDRWTAVYDLAAHTVYLPDGTKLEAHSGLGDRLDDPHHVNERNRGATPPHVYSLEAREQLFHGVQALRLNPVGGGDIFGRAGLLAHSYMLGPNGDSNGCVSFRDYDAFLKAFQNGQVKRLAVVASLN